ncbi:universal stress protein [Malonomonas rubra]|uniref:universal stress protein n=1 Tax=Malonomonas rubra TaxID=57040 RepID=UPI0026EC817D|nr:universal stress protein [Malonomonas rubra]
MLPIYKKILVTTDLSPNAEHAFKHAITIAKQHNSEIYLLSVIPEVDTSFRSYVTAVMGTGQLEKLEREHEVAAREEIKQEIDHFAKEELADQPELLKQFAGSIVIHGHPVAGILQTADKLDADLIIMGTHGKGDLQYAFLGSVTEKVLRKSKRPVLAIPLPH